MLCPDWRALPHYSLYSNDHDHDTKCACEDGLGSQNKGLLVSNVVLYVRREHVIFVGV